MMGEPKYSTVWNRRIRLDRLRRTEDYQVSIFKNRTPSGVLRKIKALLNSDAVFIPRAALGRGPRWPTRRNNRERIAPGKAPSQARSDTHPPDAPAEDTPIFFVVGYQKSGTTWLMKMLDSHPEILCQGEGRPFGRNWRQEHLKQRRGSYPPTSLYHAMLSAEDLRYWIERSVWSKGEDTDEHLANLTGLAIEYFLTQRLLKSGKKLVGDKTVLLDAEIVREIRAISPEAKVIHIIRDGRDVAISATHHGWNRAVDQGGTHRITPEQLAKREAYRKDPQALLETGGGIFPDGELRKSAARWSARVGNAVKDGPALFGANYAEVKYEDLLENPAEELRRLLEFLEADASEQVVSGCVSAATFERLSGGRKRGREAASFYRKGIAGDWKNVFTEQNKQEFKAAAGELLVELGYEEGA
jgi:hypothetical protein